MGEELRLLALALLDRVEPGVRSVLAGLRVEAAEAEAAAGAGAGAGVPPPTAGVPATCAWCPLCNLVGLARGDRPELAGRLAEQAGALLVTLRAVLQEPTAAAAGSDHGPAGAADPGEGASPRVERIDVRPAGGGC